ncbi:unnamed protein product [Heligmosomoides polygyrus]|uniref:HAD family hydrolase n=1 Tax=Heligmosomoides polygyrus TaxID=6339 RepID=A0A3P7YQ73_HELPZ|nr:unnamed protein product [Heligmosomoides polygyrus]
MRLNFSCLLCSHILRIQFKTVATYLRDRGLGVAVVSNFDARLSGILRGLDLLPLFDLVVTSGEVGVEKPNPVIFERVVRHYRLSGASRLLHVGDHLLKDYEAAKDFGASAILFDPLSKRGDFYSDIQSLLPS